MTSPIRIVIADDHPTLSQGLRGLLEVEPDLNVIGEAGNVSDVVDRVLALKPDILLLDLKMPSQPKAKISARGGLDVLTAISGSACITRAILFAADMDTQEIVEANRTRGSRCSAKKRRDSVADREHPGRDEWGLLGGNKVRP